jgi:ribosomal protein S18 acetylase RimI-like enzyme
MITEAGIADEAGIVALWHACELTRPWNNPEEDFRRALATATATVLVLRVAQETAGSVMAGFDGHRGWIYYLAVAPAHRRRGHAAALLAAATNWLQRRGCPKVELMVRAGNEQASALYRKLGWEKQAVDVYGIWTEKN